MMEAKNSQHIKEMESMKHIQIEIQEIKTSIESICNRLNKGENIISDLEDRIAASDHEKKNVLKASGDHEKKIS